MTQRVVFASGKGGTGKTTLTALMAILAASELPVIFADCDVEAANLPLALGAVDASCAPFAGSPAAVLDLELCRSCGQCQSVCRFNAIEWLPGKAEYAIDPLLCEGCGRCATVCPFGAIAMVPGTAGDVITARSPIGPLVYGSLRPGEDLSGKLVTEVRAKADLLAAGGDAALMLIDGPPGTGCPAIASITNTDLLVAVTEPTLSGEHDLARLTALARRLDVPVAIVLNKADLSESGAARIRALAAAESLPLIAEVPFDPALAALAQRAALGTLFSGDHRPGDTPVAPVGPGMPAELPGLKAVQTAWGEIRSRIGE